MSAFSSQFKTLVSGSSSLSYSPANNGAFYDESLFTAAISGNLYLICNLLEQNVNVNICNSHGNSSLHLAAFNNHASTVELLLQNGADLNSINLNKNTALHLAAQKGCHEIVMKLILSGANGNLINLDKETPLQIAAKSFEKVSKELKAAQKYQKLLGTPPEILLQIESELENFQRTKLILEAQQTANTELTSASAVQLKSLKQTRSKNH